MDALQALLPIGIILSAGWALGKLRIPSERFWEDLDRLLYYILLPVLLVRSALKTDTSLLHSLPTGLATVCSLGILTILLCLGRQLIASNGAAFSSVIQGAVRVNVYAGFAVAAAAYGDRGVVLFSIVIAFAVPLDNILSIVALNIFASRARTSWKVVIWRIISNPLIVSLLIGYTLRGLGVGLGGSLSAAMDLSAEATLPLAILAVGAGFKFQAMHLNPRPLLIAVAARQVVLPIIAYGTCHMLGLDGLERAAVLLHATLPTGPAAYAVAKQMGGDAPLMASIIAATTLFAGISVPGAMLIFG